MADTLRNHHGMRHLNLPERVADRYMFEQLEGEDRWPSGYAAMPGDDISTHPNNVYTGNPFLNRSPLQVRRMLLAGKFDPYPRLKTKAIEFLRLYRTLTGEDTLGDSAKPR